MARRRRARNPDGSLVTPLSPAQEAALAKGRAAMAAKFAGDAGTKEKQPETKASGRRVEQVKHGEPAKTKRPRTKASTAARSRPANQGGTKEKPEQPTKAKGFGDRLVDWLTAGE